MDLYPTIKYINYFKINSHGMGTRNLCCLTQLLKIRTEYARNSFCYMGAKTYNDLPTDIKADFD